MKLSAKVSLGGIVAALSLALMFLTNVIPFGTYAFPALAGIFLTVIVIELNARWALAIYAGVSTISFLILADKEAALFYVIFLGFYPILKSFIERLRIRMFQWIVKILVFNICMIASFYIGIGLLSVPKESFEIFGFYLPWLFLILGNFVFLIYDVCVSRLITIYLLKWQKKLRKNTKL